LEERTLALSQETLAELEDVLSREKFDRFIPKAARQAFMENIKRNAVFYDIYNPISLCRDPKDNKFLDVAIASYADYLITGDDDLLVLKVIGNTTIITPRAFADTFALGERL
jgi:putative PIN family toxin of toxin-antitoxin system